MTQTNTQEVAMFTLVELAELNVIEGGLYIPDPRHPAPPGSPGPTAPLPPVELPLPF
jgi:hypothetical protein